MYFQDKKGFYAYHYDIIGEMFTVRYPTLEDFFRTHSEFFISNAIVNEIFKHITGNIKEHYFTSHYATAVYDECGNLYTRDRLLGLYRDWIRKRNDDWVSPWMLRFHTGRKRSCYGGHRRIRTFQEGKMWFDVDPEYNIRGRAGRSKANLPDTWDDYYRHTEKNWKSQRKTKHQYK